MFTFSGRALEQYANRVGHQFRGPRQNEESDAGRDERIRV
jgi:hypothetical protein